MSSPLIQSTLVLPVVGQPIWQVLLGNKKQGFGQGKITGFGGKIKPGEAASQAAVRELNEECGLLAQEADLDYAACLDFIFPNHPAWSQRVYVYRLWRWQGTPAESAEMQPLWFECETLPYDRMWDDGRYWLPPLLADQRLQGRFIFDQDNATVVQVTMIPISIQRVELIDLG